MKPVWGDLNQYSSDNVVLERFFIYAALLVQFCYLYEDFVFLSFHWRVAGLRRLEAKI